MQYKLALVENFFFLGKIYEILNSFSMVRNVNAILNTNVRKSDLTYLHGIRVLSLFWIILYHVHFQNYSHGK